MNNLYKVFIVLVITSIAIYWYAFDYDEIRDRTIDPALLPFKDELVTLSEKLELNKITGKEARQKAYEIMEEMPEKYSNITRQYQIAMSAHPDITFHGRIMDQNGNPVNGVTVIYTGTSTYLSAGAGTGKVVSDSQGYFEIDTEGAALNLGQLMHPDIVYSYPPDIIDVQQSVKRTKYLRSGDDGTHDNWRNYTSKQEAFVINVWRKGVYEGAKSGRLGGYYYPGDGAITTLNFLGSNHEEIKLDENSDGHIRISCTRHIMQHSRDYGSWAVNISPVNGGIQETNDVYLNLAPASGYKDSINIDMNKAREDYSSNLEKRYYFYAKNKTVYGSLYVNYEPHAIWKEHLCGITITYKINATGSRNLEQKSNERSKSTPASPTALASISQ